jgi:DNA-binding CsgD family transcriptional regulator
MFENPEAAFGGTKPMLDIIEAIYAAAQQPTLWDDVLDRISTAIEGGSISLFAQFADETTPTVMAMAKTDPNAWHDYASHFAWNNPLMARGEEFFGPGETWFSHPVIGEVEFERTEFYYDFFRRYDMYHTAALQISLDGLPANLTCQRPKASGVFGAQADIVLQTLRPHLQRALTVYRQIETMQTRTLGLEAALDAFDHAVLGLDSKGKVVLVSRGAEALLRAGDGMRVSNGEFSTADAAQNARLKATITEAVTGQFATAASASVLIRRRSHATPLQLTVVPHRSHLPGRSALAALVFIGDPARRSPSKAALLRAMYALSPTEARVADLLAEGLTVREVADRLNAALETARFHTKKILAKTGARRQAELMKLMVALPNV